jgi:hypothetical protein
MLTITRASLPTRDSPPSPCHVYVGERLPFSLHLSAASLAAHGWRVDQLDPSCFSADLVASPHGDVRGYDDAHSSNGNEISGPERSQQRHADDAPLLRRCSSIEPEDESILSPLPSNRAAHTPRMSALPDGGVCVHFEMDLGAVLVFIIASSVCDVPKT